MAVDFGALLTLDQKKSMVSNAIVNLAARGYEVELNSQALELSRTAENSDAVDAALASNAAVLADLEAGITAYQDELAALEALPAE